MPNFKKSNKGYMMKPKGMGQQGYAMMPIPRKTMEIPMYKAEVNLLNHLSLIVVTLNIKVKFVKPQAKLHNLLERLKLILVQEEEVVILG